MPGPVNGAIGIGEFNQPIGLHFLDVQNGRWPSRLRTFDYALVDGEDDRFLSKCTVFDSDAYRAIDLSCLTREVPDLSSPAGRISRQHPRFPPRPMLNLS